MNRVHLPVPMDDSIVKIKVTLAQPFPLILLVMEFAVGELDIQSSFHWGNFFRLLRWIR